jgi:hypothetical protein
MLSEIKVLALKLQNKQKILINKAKVLQNDVHESSSDCRNYGREEMHRIETRQDAKSWHQDLPNNFFQRTLSKLRNR